MDMDEDDLFLYGDSKPTVAETARPAEVPTTVPQPISVEQAQALSTSNGVVGNLEQKAEEEVKQEQRPTEITEVKAETTPPKETEVEATSAEAMVHAEDENRDQGEEEAEGEDEGEGSGDEVEDEEDESEDDIEIIMEPAARSLDFRQQRPAPGRSVSAQTPTKPSQPSQPSLTTEYTPRERGKLPSTPQPSDTTTIPAPPLSATPGTTAEAEQKLKIEAAVAPADIGPDPSTLPPARAPPSHPTLDLDTPGVFDGRSILEIDLSALAEKPWRRPGSDLSDWFNYGFDEISWEAYCYRRREIGEVASVLKTNVLNFAGMPEDQLTALPPEIRTMVMAGATAMMNQAGPNGMIPPNAGMNMNGDALMNMMNMNPMMNPAMMQEMGMVGMGGEMGPMGPGMGMGGPGGGPAQGMGGAVMGQGPGPGMGGGGGLSGGVGIGTGGAPQTGSSEQMGMGEGFGAGQPSMMGMGMGGEFPMQDTNMGQQMFQQQQQMEQRSATPTQPSVVASQSRGTAPPTAPFRGRGMPPTMPLRARGGFAARGRPLPVRPSSPLPPNVPTGPRNKNKYKDIDGSAPAIDGLDYGGGGGKESRNTPPDYDDRSSRKRRSSPSGDDGRSSKRR